MKVLVFGGGAVGLAISSCLIASGSSVDILGRDDTVRALREGGLVRTGIFGEHRSPSASFRCASSLQEFSGQRYDYVLISTKSFDSAKAAEDLAADPGIAAQVAEGNCRLVLFQNGWGNAEIFASRFPKRGVYSARVITGFRRPEKNRTDITVHADAIRLGSLFGLDPAVLQDLSDAIGKGGIPCGVVQDVAKDLWAKMLYNCALNPLGALFGVSYGVLGDWDQTRLIMNGIISEIYAVMESGGYRTHWSTPGEYQTVFYGRLVPSTYNHEASTLQDIRAGKRTEIDALNGAVIELGQRHSITSPYNTVVFNMVKFLEARMSVR